MKLVLTLLIGQDDGDVAEANVLFHLNAGVDVVLAAVETRAVAEALSSLDDRVRVEHVVGSDGDVRTRLARQAVTEHGADWVISGGAHEFWWPRGENLKEVLAPIPERYTIVQGLRRDLFPRLGGEGPALRRSLERAPTPAGLGLLRPVFRADADVVVQSDGTVDLRRSVPLRAWYPIEVMALAGEVANDDEDLVPDSRLEDALRAIRSGAVPLTFRVPDIVEDASYAVECAAVGEVDLPRLEQYITELERRVDWLEQRFWPRVLRKVARLGRRSS
jgi:hypothetical protein